MDNHTSLASWYRNSTGNQEESKEGVKSKGILTISLINGYSLNFTGNWQEENRFW